ncbi:MAG: PH domain-containing protein, partial [Clostridiales bacterium]|nr:PH domain-containing protein [Clostridiales bacterium]
MNGFEKPDPRAVRSWRLARTIRTAIFFAAAAGLLLLLHFTGAPRTFFLTAAAVFAALCLYSLISTLAFPAVEYRQWGYRIEEDKVIIRHGIFFIKTSVIPMIRIQNVTTNQGPIDRHYGLCGVELALASGTFD